FTPAHSPRFRATPGDDPGGITTGLACQVGTSQGGTSLDQAIQSGPDPGSREALNNLQRT
ncbi:MAG: hypothetical protein OEV53_05415, partial [Nitrospira sp.]|nr:hypothetical protein [Nitrospira sp.]